MRRLKINPALAGLALALVAGAALAAGVTGRRPAPDLASLAVPPSLWPTAQVAHEGLTDPDDPGHLLNVLPGQSLLLERDPGAPRFVAGYSREIGVAGGPDRPGLLVVHQLARYASDTEAARVINLMGQFEGCRPAAPGETKAAGAHLCTQLGSEGDVVRTLVLQQGSLVHVVVVDGFVDDDVQRALEVAAEWLAGQAAR